MGSKTFESIGKPLKNRYNIVITSNEQKYQDRKAKNLVFTDDLKGVLEVYKNDSDKHVFVIGGREIYQQTYAYADYYYVSIVKGKYRGDVYFPFLDLGESERRKSGLLEKLFENYKLVKEKELQNITSYVYK